MRPSLQAQLGKRWASPKTEKAMGCLAGGVLLALSVFLLKKGGQPDYGSIGNDSGESLFHAVATAQGNVSFDMPLFHVFLSLLVHAPHALKALALWLVGIAPFALAFSLGCLVHSRKAGFAAVFLGIGTFLCFQNISLGSFNVGWEQWFYSITILIVACLTAWEGRGLDPGKNALLGIAIGLSLLVRSPLVLYAPALGAFEWMERRKSPVKARCKAFAALCCAPYVLLLPWVRMNWALYHRFIPLENGRADCNIMTAALGLVPTIQGTTMGVEGILQGQPALVWAIKEIARHPFRYLDSCASRALYAASFHPFLFALAGLSLWRNRGGAAYRRLGFLALYFFAMHCFLSLEHRYLIPLELLLAVLAAGLFVGLPAARAPRLNYLPASAVGAAFALVMALSVYTLGLVSVYAEPAQPDRSRLLDAALKDYPEDPWLWSNRGRLNISRGRPKEAAEDLRESLRLRPCTEREIWYAQALMLRGGKGRDLIQHIRLPQAPGGRWLIPRILVLRVLALMQGGQYERAAGLLAQVLQESESVPLLRRVDTGLEREVAEKFRSVDLRAARIMDEFLNSSHPEEQAVLLRALSKVLRDPALSAPNQTGAWVEWSTLKQERLAILYQEEKKYAQALRIVDGLIQDRPSEARFYCDRGVLQTLMGRKERAIEALRAAIRIDPRLLYSYATLAGLYQSMGREAEALRLYDQALSVRDPNVSAGLRSLMLDDRRRLAMRLR